MRNFASKFVVIWGWRRTCAAFLAGIVCAAAAPPMYALPAQIIALCALVWLLDGVRVQNKTLRACLWPAFVTGWAFGAGYFLLGLFWVSEAMLVEPDLFAWLIPFVLVFFPAALGVFYGLAAVIAMPLWKPGFRRIFGLAAAITFAEWLRGTIFTGFPWNALGYSAAAFDGLLQLASYVGLYGLTTIIVFLCAAPAVLTDEPNEAIHPIMGRYRGLALVALGACVFWGVGTYRLHSNPVQFDESVKLRIVQPNIPQVEKWKPENRQKIFDLYLKLTDMATSSDRAGVKDVTHVIWPESAVPFLLDENPKAMAAIADLLPEGVTLLTGAITRPAKTANLPSGGVYNSILLIDERADIIARYNKFHLVPFGEYLPLAHLLEPLGLRKLVTLPGGFIPGPGPQTLQVPNAPPMSPLICYEIVFSGNVISAAQRPAWLLNVTNDAWFGTSLGPRQHFAQARMRAIEEGLPLVRAANTGISAVIAPNGQVIRALGLGEQGVLDTYLPLALKPTFFSKMQNFACAFMIFMCVLLCVAPGRTKRWVR
ncbi:MAG: apolipoprotein N-acyltransferase [Hyphomicrobiales bacterium]